MKQVVIIGGGIAGLVASIFLAQKGISSLVIEKKSYPLQRVCGEYISNEATPFLKSLDIYPERFHPSRITRFLLSSSRGASAILPLDPGGFGISRYEFDNFLFEKAKLAGVEFMLNTEVRQVRLAGDFFTISTSDTTIEAPVVLAAHGKRSKLDIQLNRDFIKQRSPYVGVKYHMEVKHPEDLIALHNFPGGYCGICSVEGGKVNVCYLTHRSNLKIHKSIDDVETYVLSTNPLLKEILRSGRKLWPKEEVINEVSFAPKGPVEDHLLMIGDSAGMIAPLCGNGMAIAIHSAKVAGGVVSKFLAGKVNRADMEASYRKEWSALFSRRLFAGRNIQKLFGSHLASALAINVAVHSKPLARLIIRHTHGNTF